MLRNIPLFFATLQEVLEPEPARVFNLFILPLLFPRTVALTGSFLITRPQLSSYDQGPL